MNNSIKNYQLKPYYKNNKITIYKVHILDVLRSMESESVSCIMTSPPYWGLRDYGIEPVIWNDGWKGSLGLEPTFEMYIEHLCSIFDELKRVLRKDGTCWVNMGDTYGGKIGSPNAPKLSKGRINEYKSASNVKEYLQPKSLCLIPERFAIEMINRGWILRNKIIWYKRNCMPSSANDRFTVDWEPIYFFVKNKKYWFEQQFDEQTGTAHSKGKKLSPPIESAGIGHKDWHKYTPLTELTNGRNKRCIWDIPTQSCSEAHFAVFPDELCVTPIKSGCPEFICKKCGKPKEKIFKERKFPEELRTNTRSDLKKVAVWRKNGKTFGPGGDAMGSFDKTGDLSLTANAIGDYAYITFANIGTNLVAGKRYRLTYDYSETVAGFEFKLEGAATQTLGDAVAGTGQTIEFTADEDFSGAEELRIMAKTSAVAQGDFDNFSLIQIGCIAEHAPDGIGHIQWKDKSGSPEFICKKCGKPKEKIFKERKFPEELRTNTRSDLKKVAGWRKNGKTFGTGQKMWDYLEENPPELKGYTECGCNAGFKTGIVLDPFMGTGTVLKVAQRLNRRAIGIDIKQEYCDMAIKKFNQEELF